MQPFQKYAFQKTKNIFSDVDESLEKWIKPTLESGAVLHVCPMVENGVKAALHKKGSDYYLQIENDETNVIKEYEHYCEDFKFYDKDFVIEGYVEDNGNFAMTDILFHDGEDLVDKGLSHRLAVLSKYFDDLHGYSCHVVHSREIHTFEEFKKFTDEKHQGFYAGIDTSLYTEGCPSNQWCAFGKGLVKDEHTAKSKIPAFKLEHWQEWGSRIKKGVMGEFEVFKTGDSYQLNIHPVRPVKAYFTTSISFEDVDKSIELRRQFKKGNQFLVGFNKYSSPNPCDALIDSGTFTILKSTDQSTVIDFDGLGVFKGIFHVDGSSKHNFPDSSEIPTDLVYQLSFSEANIDVDKRFGELKWFGGSETLLNKCMVPIAKQDESEEERFVFGEVLVPEEIDAHGDIYSIKEVRFAAHFFMEKFGNTGLMHEQFINDQAVIIDTFVAPVKMTIEGRKIKKGTWLIGMRILSEKLFNDVKAGRLTGFSIGGIATVQELRKLMGEYGYDNVAAA